MRQSTIDAHEGGALEQGTEWVDPLLCLGTGGLTTSTGRCSTRNAPHATPQSTPVSVDRSTPERNARTSRTASSGASSCTK